MCRDESLHCFPPWLLIPQLLSYSCRSPPLRSPPPRQPPPLGHLHPRQPPPSGHLHPRQPPPSGHLHPPSTSSLRSPPPPSTSSLRSPSIIFYHPHLSVPHCCVLVITQLSDRIPLICPTCQLWPLGRKLVFTNRYSMWLNPLSGSSLRSTWLC